MKDDFFSPLLDLLIAFVPLVAVTQPISEDRERHFRLD